MVNARVFSNILSRVAGSICSVQGLLVPSYLPLNIRMNKGKFAKIVLWILTVEVFIEHLSSETIFVPMEWNDKTKLKYQSLAYLFDLLFIESVCKVNFKISAKKVRGC